MKAPSMYSTILAIDQHSFCSFLLWQTHLNVLHLWSIVSQIMCKFVQKYPNFSSFISSWFHSLTASLKLEVRSTPWPSGARHALQFYELELPRKAFHCFVWIWNSPLYSDRYLINMQVFMERILKPQEQNGFKLIYKYNFIFCPRVSSK